MGNCLQPNEPECNNIPRATSITVDTTPIKERNVPIIFLLGGPGAGKRTLCTKVAEKYDFLDIISSDLIRQEISKRTERAFTLARLMSQGRLVPTNVLLELIASKMLNNLSNKNGVIMSGFPRQKDQCRIFERHVRPPDLVLYLNVRNSVLSDRIMGRMVTITESPLIHYEDIRKQIREFHKRNRPIRKYYKKVLVIIDGESDPINVYEEACEAIDNVLMRRMSNT
ncbi:Adenylate kinase isoenzyme 5 [Dufourea novaeangliae]|uniref:Adenylate kinase isoenzyme 5 n=2 Tax=Dufourea novaeangliae TaxID=178035 RepID=A0A154P9E3_DUFNO|nr:Adenylate kinase isoenzyme 5 [Dufourea novaeangliae]